MKRFFVEAPKVSFAKQTVIDCGADVFYITKGYVNAYAVRNGVRTFIFMYKGGEVFPLNLIVNNRWPDLFEIEFQAHTLVYAKKLPRADFKAMVLSTVETNAQLMRQVLAINHTLVDRVIQLSHKEVKERLIERLLFLCARFGEEDENNVIIDPGFTNKDIANTINSTRETVNKMMRELEHKGLIAVSGQTIAVPSVEALKNELSTPE